MPVVRVTRRRRQLGFGSFMRERRIALHLTQSGFGRIIGMSQRSMSVYEAEDWVLGREQIALLAAELGENEAAWLGAAGYSVPGQDVALRPVEPPRFVELPIVGRVVEGALVERVDATATVPIPLMGGVVPTHALEVAAHGLHPVLESGDYLAYRAGGEGVRSGDTVVVDVGDGRRKRRQLARYLGESVEGRLLAPITAPESAPGTAMLAEIVGVVISSTRLWRKEG